MDMPSSSLEEYFDKYIANDALSTEKQEQKQEQEELSPEEELFLKLLPDELLTLKAFTSDGTAENRTVDKPSPDSSSTQNSSAGVKFAQASASSVLEASTVNPITPVVLESLTELPKPTPVICNVLSVVNLGCHLDLNIIARNMWNVEYDPKTFRGLIARNREPKATVTIYSNGKMTCTGANSIENSRLVSRRFACKVQKLGFPVRFLNFKIHNLVATCRTFPVYLEKLCELCRPNCSYEPHIFNGFFYRMAPSVTATVFTTGSIILCGTKSREELNEKFETIFSLNQQCRRP